MVTLTATATAGSAFAGWSGSGCSGTGTCVVTMSAARSVTATFTTAVAQPTPTASTFPAGPTPPASTSPLPTVSGDATVGQTLSGTNGAWSGTPPLFYTYQWQRCVPGCTSIAGATKQSYTLLVADTGARVRMNVTATNAAEHASAESALVGPIAPSAAQMETLLAQGLVPRGKAAKITAILKARGYTSTFSALIAGVGQIKWYSVPRGAHLTKGPSKPVLVAAGKPASPRRGRAS